jgi:hypothetical protein
VKFFVLRFSSAGICQPHSGPIAIPEIFGGAWVSVVNSSAVRYDDGGI